MSSIDWIILGLVLAFIVLYGLAKTRNQSGVSDFVTGGNKASWWTIGLSVMATQASAITFLSTPGQAFHDGMGFVQFYFGLPIAMVLISLFFVPIYHRLKVFTAYAYLEDRFNVQTRTLTAVFFLIQRGLAAGITIFAPSIILSAVLGWDLVWLNILIGSLVVVYTVTGGTRAVNITQKQQMGVIFGGMFLAFLMLLNFLPLEVGLEEALTIAGAQDKMNILDFSFDFDNRYTFWSGIIGGSFLALSYFGTDQSQVQRYLSGRTLRQSQMGLIMNGMLKVPMQFFILLIGVLVFVFYQFNASPLNFNPTNERMVMDSPYAAQYKVLDQEKDLLMGQIQTLQLAYLDVEDPAQKDVLQNEISALNTQQLSLRKEARELILAADKDAETNDKDYVFIHFILTQLPVGLIGLLLAVILSAAMSSTASEINALGATTAVDLYQRHRPGHSEKHYLKITRYFTLIWGVIAILVACTAPLFDNLIQLVNIIGSIFYGNILGVFLAAFFIRHIKGLSIFWAALINQGFVISLFVLDLFEVIKLPYLWLNVIGCVAVILIALIVQFFQGDKH
ncbi:sodium:solute symporter [Flavobacteriaceae bacterium]|nr:sodium:solute symporter [Flavobacteriaceae bacterium]MDB2587374.1 sodium:solute symporter [Flavobacteriaceae bacterium]